MCCRAKCKGQGLFPAWITAEGNISVPYKFPSHLKYLSGKELQSAEGIQGTGCRDMRLGSVSSEQGRACNSLQSILSLLSPSLYTYVNFQTLFIFCWHLCLNSVAAAQKGRKNMQLEYSKIPLRINRKFCLHIHIRCSWCYDHFKWNKSRPFQYL